MGVGWQGLGRRAVVLGAVLLGLGTFVAPAAADLPGRGSDPVVLSGSEAPGLLGKAPDRIVAFSWKGQWNQVPVQVDERAVIDFRAVRSSNNPRPFATLAYADPGTLAGADPDRSLDGDDEIALMASDTGSSAAILPDPAGVLPGTRVPLKVEDPLDPGSVGYAYLFESAGGLAPSAGKDYVEYRFELQGGLSYPDDYDFSGSSAGNAESSFARTNAYRLDFGDRWITDGLRVRASGAARVDILDGEKTTVGTTSCVRNERTFSEGGGGFIANIDGPVRAIRSYIGANSGTYTQRDHVLYRSRQDETTVLRVHTGIDDIVMAFDYSPEATGMTYRSSLDPAGFTVDGVPDPATAGRLAWEQVTGPQGTIENVLRVASDIPGLTYSSFYLDQANLPAPHSMLCSGDEHAFAASGPRTWGIAQYLTDPTLDGRLHHLSGTRTTFFDPPGRDAPDAAKRAAQVDAPLSVGTGAAVDPVLERPEQSAGSLSMSLRWRNRVRPPQRWKVRPGRWVRPQVVLRNEGPGFVSSATVCATGPKRRVVGLRCRSFGSLRSLEAQARWFPLKVKRGVRARKPMRVMFVADGPGRPGATIKLRSAGHRPRR